MTRHVFVDRQWSDGQGLPGWLRGFLHQEFSEERHPGPEEKERLDISEMIQTS